MAKTNPTLEGIADAIDNLSDIMDDSFKKVDSRFEKIESELQAIKREQREMREWLERIDNRLSGVESDIKEIYDRLVILEKRLPHLTEKEYREMEHKLNQLISWAKAVSHKTGIVLPKL